MQPELFRNRLISNLLALFLLHSQLSVAQVTTDAESNPTEIASGVYLLPGLSCNVLAVTGPSGLLLVDNGSAGDVDQLSRVIERLDSGPVRIALNTHIHFDHIGGNEMLGQHGAIILAHERLRPRLQTEWSFPDQLGLRFQSLPPYAETALPSVSLQDSTTIHFGGHEVSLVHLPAAHTDADLVVFLHDVNILHTGDLFASGGFVPPLDSYHGGTIDGWIAAVGELIGLITDSTRVVPGHGPVADRQALRDFQEVLVISRNRIAALVDEGKTLDEVLGAEPMADLGVRPSESFIRLVYAELAWSPMSSTQ